MDNRLTRGLYDRSPGFLRSGMASVWGWRKNRTRFGREYTRWARFFADAHRWSEEELRAYQETALREHVARAFEHVPFWRKRFRELGVEPSAIRTVADLEKLPLLEKAEVTEAGRDLVSDSCDADALLWFPTSGSTGTPLQVPRPPAIEAMEWAFTWTRFCPDVKRGDPYASFTGLELIPPGREKPPFWVDNWANRQRMYSIWHMNERNLAHYVADLDRRYSFSYRGYPSAMYVLADFMLREGLRLRRPPAHVISASEELQPQYAETIREAFGCRVWNRWGLNEMSGSITEYACGHLHYDMDYAVLEFLPIGEEADGILAEIVSTNVHDHAWPLLRYRTGDLVVYDPDDRCEAGVPGRVIRRIHGRTGHYFTLPDGSRCTNISVIAKKCRHVRYMQVVQEQPGAIVVRIVTTAGYGPEDERDVVQQFRRKLGPELGIEVAYVDALETTSSGKAISIINRAEPVGSRPAGQLATF